MAFSLGYFSLFVQGSGLASQDDLIRINQLKSEFQQSTEPISIINFNSFYYSRNHFQLLDPLYIMPEASATNVQERGHRYSTNRDCFEDLTEMMNRSNFQKVWIWEEFRCGKRFRLPHDFFKQAPFIHPSGKSYAFLAFESGRNHFSRRDWVLAHLPYFHVSEFNQLSEQIGDLGRPWSILSNLSYEDLAGLARGQEHILTREFLFSRVKYPDFYFIFEYRVYPRAALEDFLRDSRYMLREFSANRDCFYKDGQMCWEYNTRHLTTMMEQASVLFLVGLLIIIVILIRLIIVKLKTQRLEDERRRLALQVLTHEFRTPIASMILVMERLFKRVDELDPETQEAVLHLSSNVYRLQRLSETSRNYLRIQKGRRLVDFNIEVIADLEEFLSDHLYAHIEKYGSEKIVIHAPKIENSWQISFDPYWIGICLVNLVNNAVDHGAFPIEVSCEIEGSQLIIRVQDAGDCHFENLSDMTEEFIKGRKSEGTGLGLNIVAKVMKDMGGALHFDSSPTRFSLLIKNAIKLIKE